MCGVQDKRDGWRYEWGSCPVYRDKKHGQYVLELKPWFYMRSLGNTRKEKRSEDTARRYPTI